jgi:hypothetical protein
MANTKGGGVRARVVVTLKTTTGSRFLWGEAARAAGLSLSGWIRGVCDAALSAPASTARETPIEGKD